MASPAAWAQSVAFQGLPSCLIYSCRTSAAALSADGRVLTGTRTGFFVETNPVFVWSETSGFRDIRGGFLTHTAAGISADGSVVVGSSLASYAWRWTSSGVIDLGSLGGQVPGASTWSEAKAVSADGSVVAGMSLAPAGFEAFRWTAAQGMIGIGSLGGNDPSFRSSASGISGNGAVIVGQSNSPAGRQAFRWTQAGGMMGLGDLPGGVFQSQATAVTADGAVVVGQGAGANGPEAFRWTATGGMLGLGALSAGAFRSIARAVSADGSVVVGDSDTASGAEAFIWTQAFGMRRIADGLIAAGVSLDGWTLQNAIGISADGRTIAGNGLGPTPRGATEPLAWIARSPTGSLPPGLTTPDSLIQSVANMPSVTLSGDRMSRSDIRRVLTAARGSRLPRSEPVRVAAQGDLPPTHLLSDGGRELYALGSIQTWDDDPRTQGTAPALSVGVAADIGSGFRIGAGVSTESSREDTIYGGRYRTDTVGVHAFTGWRSRHPGLRVLVLADYLDVDASIRRGYVNGAGTSTSKGSTGGHSASVLARLEYEVPLRPGIELVPYLDYGWTRTSLDPYAEDPASGPFPAAFEKQTYTSSRVRVGLELVYRHSRFTELSTWLSGAHRIKGDNAAIRGRYIGLGSFDIRNLPVPDSDRIELGAGLHHLLTRDLRLFASIGASSSGFTSSTSNYFAVAGIGFSF